MYVFVWESIERCTTRHHSGGGVVVFAGDQARARVLALERGADIGEKELPDDVRPVPEDSEEAVYIMPDAGCC